MVSRSFSTSPIQPSLHLHQSSFFSTPESITVAAKGVFIILAEFSQKLIVKRRLRISDRRLRVSDRRFCLLGIYYPPAQKLIVKRRLFISDRRLRISGRRLCRIRNILFADRYLRSDHSRPIVSLIPVHLLVVEAQFPSVRSVSVVMGTERE
ncbi:Uncharacterized protein Fot_56640 [Forsythia ovata]|uniref:Uncharacterized protein n=1 Tax=Forsythia ovata TaxID=205694 RepID=A0ABD1NYZ1_9LAMI